MNTAVLNRGELLPKLYQLVARYFAMSLAQFMCPMKADWY